MPIEAEAFYAGGVQVGALLRCYDDSTIQTRSVFKFDPEEPVVLSDQRTTFAGHVTDWSTFSFRSPVEGVDQHGVRGSDGAVVVDGSPVPALPGTLPSYAAHLLLLDLLADDAATVRFTRFLEGGQAVVVHPAAFTRAATVPVAIATPWGDTATGCTEVQLQIDDRPGNRFWCSGSQVVKSDWCGAQSYLTSDRELLLGDLDPEVGTAIIEFFETHQGC